MAAINSFREDSSVDSGNNDDPHSSKYIRLNDGSRRRSTTSVAQCDEYGEESLQEDRFKSGKKGSNIRSMAQDAHLRHYQEHLEERRMKSKRLREGKMVTLLRKKPTVVEKRDVACQVTPADLGLDDWEDEEEVDEEEEYEENDYEMNFAPRPYSRPLAAPGPGPWQDVSTTNFNAEAYQQWYGEHWLGQNETQYENSAEIREEDLPELTEEQTYRYVYYYYNYYAAMEANDGMPSNIYDESQNYLDSTVANHPGAWQDTDNTTKESSSKKQMRNLFDEWRQKYESWYRATFGKDVRETQREEDATIMAHKAQLEAARLAQLREEQELRLERPGRPESLLPAPPIVPERVDTPVISSSENQQSLLPPPPPPPSAPPPETPPPPPPETPRPETPAAQVAAAAAAAHILGANMSTPADVAAAIARLSNTDLTAILSSVNRATFNTHKPLETKSKEDGSDATVTTAAPTLIRLPPLPVIGLPNPLATPIFPPPMPIAIRRDGLTATATVLPAPTAAATILTPHMVVALPPALPASLAPPALPSALPSIPQTMLLQPTIKFGPPFKPFGVFQGRTEDKWGPDAPLGRYGQRKEEVTKEIKARQDAKKIHQSDPASDSQKMSDRDYGQVNGSRPDSALIDTTNSTISSSGSMKGDVCPEVQVAGAVDQHDEDKISEKENNEDILSDRDESDVESVSSDDSLISTRTQSIAIGPRRSRVAPSITSAVGPGPNARSKFLMASAVNTSSIPVEKLTSLAESAAKRAVSDGLWYAPSQPLNSLRLPKQAMIHTLQSHLKPKINDLQNREKDPKLQLTLSYAKFFIDVTRHLLDMSVQFVMGSMHRLPTERARHFYGEDLPEEVSNGMKLCDVYVGDVFISQGGANSSLGAKEAATRQAFKVLSRPGYILGSTRLWQDVDHLVLCISEFPLTVPILPPFLLDPCSPAIVHGPQPPSEIGQLGPGGDCVDEESGWEMEDEEDWLIQSVAINPKPLENLWLYENYDERSVVAALCSIGERKYERLRQKMQRKKRRERLEADNETYGNESDEDYGDINSSLVSKRERRASSISQFGDDVHETALADMAALTLAEEEVEVPETANVTDECESTTEPDPESLTILSRSCDFSHMMLSVEVEMNRDATFTCCIFIDRQFCADAIDQPTAQQARTLAASRALTLLRLTQPAVGLDGAEVGEEAVVDSLMWITRDKTIRPLHSIMTEHGVKGFEWDRLFMYYAESAAIEPFFISQRELPRLKWSEVKKEAEKWGLLVKESRVGTPQEGEDAVPLSLTVCKRMPLTTVKRRLMRQGRCGHFLLLRRGVYPTSEDEEYYVSDDEDEDDGNRTSLKLTVNETDLTPPVEVEVKEEPPDEDMLEDLIFLGGAPTSSECEIIDDLPKTIIPGFDY